MFELISFKKPWKKITPINKGWSKDKKYHIIANDDFEYLLRISDISLYDKKNKQFEYLKKIESLNINTSKPIEFGKLNDSEVYTILSWLKGEDALSIVPTLNEEDQYLLGIDAGRILKKIHSLPVDTNNINWWENYQKKIQYKINLINDCKLKFEYKDLLIKYVIDNMYLIKDTKTTFQHGDFHLGNMIVDDNLKIGIIDFDKYDIAGPYDDFKPFCWNVMKSPLFETGLIDGYFNNNIPKDFFPILALYAAESLLGHLPWATRFNEEEIKIAFEVADNMMMWYDNFKIVVPNWYKKIK